MHHHWSAPKGKSIFNTSSSTIHTYTYLDAYGTGKLMGVSLSFSVQHSHLKQQ